MSTKSILNERNYHRERLPVQAVHMFPQSSQAIWELIQPNSGNDNVKGNGKLLLKRTKSNRCWLWPASHCLCRPLTMFDGLRYEWARIVGRNLSGVYELKTHRFLNCADIVKKWNCSNEWYRSNGILANWLINSMYTHVTKTVRITIFYTLVWWYYYIYAPIVKMGGTTVYVRVYILGQAVRRGWEWTGVTSNTIFM